MKNSTQSRILVGISGSPGSVAALRWAVREAAQRGLRVEAVLAWRPAPAASYAVRASRPRPDEQQHTASHVLADVLMRACGHDVPADLRTEVIEGAPERVLIDRSLGADLLVLGAASAGWTTGRSIGPVIRSCLSHAHCPVVIVLPEGQARGSFDAPELAGSGVPAR
jgi:nucleotide-binding universal stress UspA family protein